MVYRLIEYLASMGHSSIWKLICAICVCNLLTVGVHLSSTPSISGPGSATEAGHFVSPDLGKNCLQKLSGDDTGRVWFFRNTIRVSNNLNADHAGHFVSPDLGKNCLQKLSADDTRREL